MNVFQYLTPLVYGILTLLWGYIGAFYAIRLFRGKADSALTRTLLQVLALGALCTFVESVFFGIRYTSLVGFLPDSIHEVLEQPEYVFLPKFFNACVAGVIIFIIIRRWLPHEEQEKREQARRAETLETLVRERTADLETTNARLEADIAERSRLESALRVSDARFRAIYDYGGHAVAIVDKMLGIVECNQAMLDMLGYTFEEIRAKGIRGITHPDYVDRDVELAQGILAGERDWCQIEKCYLHKNGGIVWGNLSLTSIRDSDGQPLYLMGVVENITERMHAQQAIVDSEEHFRTLVQNASDVITVHDSEGIIFYESPSAAHVFGYEPGGLLGHHPLEFVHPEDREKTAAALQRATVGPRTGAPTVMRVRHAGGEWVFVEALAQNLLEHPSIHGVVITSRDVTRRMKAEANLRRNETLLQTFFDSTPMHMGVVEVLEDERDVRCVTLNSAAIQVLGRPAEELLGKTARELGLGETETTQWMDACLECARSGQPVRFQRRMDLPARSFSVDALIAPIETNHGAPPHLLFVVDDVSERVKAQEEIDNQRILLETILSQAGDAILVCGQNGEVLFVNDAARRIGRIPDEVPITEVTPALWGTAFTPAGDEIPFSDWSIPRALRGEVYLAREARMVRADGSHYDILISFAPVRNAGGQIIAAVATFSDITQRKVEEEERRKLEAQIQHSQKLESLGVLAGGIAHDFNNLLVGILGNADLALSELSPSAPSRGYILDLIKAAQRASDLSKQMLAYSGKGKFSVEPLNLNEIIREMAHLLEVSISKKALLRYNLMDALPLVEADATQIRQIVMNLITNASDALGDSDGVISITTHAKHCGHADFHGFYLDSALPEGPYVVLEISDSGCGMEPDTLSRIFEPFFTTKFTGRGLGLAAVLGIVRGHRGTLKVYSEPNRGTAFKIFLPASGQVALPSLHTDYGAGEWRGTGLVLLVDDEDVVRRVTTRMLSRLGFDVIVASDGQEAVELFVKRPHEFVCVLLDLTMPRMDGETAYGALRQIRGDVPVILTSGYNEQEVQERFAGRGMAGFVQKPFKMEELHAALRRVLTRANPGGREVPAAE